MKPTKRSSALVNYSPERHDSSSIGFGLRDRSVHFPPPLSFQDSDSGSSASGVDSDRSIYSIRGTSNKASHEEGQVSSSRVRLVSVPESSKSNIFDKDIQRARSGSVSPRPEAPLMKMKVNKAIFKQLNIIL